LSTVLETPETEVTPSPPVKKSGRSRRLLGALRRPQFWILSGVVGVIGYLTLVPLLYLAWGTFFDENGFTLRFFQEAYRHGQMGEMLWNTVVFALGSTALAMALGTVLAYLVVRTDVPAKGLVFAASMIPLIVPGILMTVSWVFLASPRTGLINNWLDSWFGIRPFDVYSMPGMIFVQGLHLAPLVFLLMFAAFRSMDPSLEESALTSGAGLLTVARRVTLPLVRPALVAAAILIFVRGVEAFEVPAMLGMSHGTWLISARIWAAFNQYPVNYGEVGALSMTLLAIISLILFCNSLMSRRSKRFQTVTGKAFRPRPIELRGWRWPVFGFVLLFFIVAVVLPMLVLVYVSLQKFYTVPSWESIQASSLDNYREVLSTNSAVRSIRNSFILALAAPTVVMFLTAIASWLVVRTKVRGRWLVDNLTFIPIAIPGLVLGVALLFVYLRSPIPVYGTLWILFIAYVTKDLPYGMRYVSSSMYQIGAELEEAGYVSGASWWQVFRRIVAPLLVSGILAGWIYIAIVSFRELSTSVLLYSPGTEVLPTIIWEYWEDGTFGPLTALGVLMIIMTTVVVLLARRVSSEFGVKG
jgi:iron(III) transport system permease protein